ncbi:MAG: hypothetical protein PF694_09270 [Bacteroidetes bacterium]|jgi:hypothetical protein|nr:hypothetical protein [Bacteroidota bacterium]
MIHLKVPTSFGQCTGRQLEFLSRLLLLDLPAADIKVRCFLEFTGLALIKSNPMPVDGKLCYHFRHKIHGRFVLDTDRFADMISRLAWIDQPVTHFELPNKNGRARACNSRLYGLQLDAWLMLDLLYGQYASSKESELLSQMLAVVYTRPGELFEEGEHIAARARRFKGVAPWKKHLVFMWYTAVKLWLMHKYFYVFAGSGSDADTPVDEMIMGLISSLNEGNVANNQVIKTTDVHEVLFELNRKIEYSKSLKSKTTK